VAAHKLETSELEVSVRHSGLTFLTVEPETSGYLIPGKTANPVRCVFDTWLGDDLVRAYPAVLARTPVKDALLSLRDRTGFEITRARIRASGFYRQHSPGKRLPVFWAIQVSGRPGRDDMGITPAGVLVVSSRVLSLLLQFRIARALLAQYAPAGA
jgi:hypothetical protein